MNKERCFRSFRSANRGLQTRSPKGVIEDGDEDRRVKSVLKGNILQEWVAAAVVCNCIPQFGRSCMWAFPLPRASPLVPARPPLFLIQN
ncbi:hypothetical protein J4Q44_G00367470 [Coregonus suidteri]|uniref:Uncharacterized protein n=1 Tax=Coregonus suidteri TaxID=861788 RepID=A0AAN8KVA2_9TELE